MAFSRGARWFPVSLLTITVGTFACGDPELLHGNGGSGGADGSDGGSGAGNTNGDGGGFSFGGSRNDGGAGGQGVGGIDMTGCGDGAIQAGEVCDDGNSAAGDGCSADCATVEQDYACPDPGEPCVSTVECGDGQVSGQETCDDGDAVAGDGCSASCEVELGWQCIAPGQPCIAAQCGDGVIAGNEECEDDDGATPVSGDGCSDTCQREFGFECGLPGEPCHVTVCNDGVWEGDEPCDDGNDDIGDGCNPFCEVEPNCSGGACVSACGDGLILPSDAEECDDGNTSDGDGCSSACVIEAGWDCVDITGALPPTLQVPVAFRDFIRAPAATKHADFEQFSGSQETLGLVASQLNASGKPAYTGICGAPIVGPCPYGQQTSTEANFNQWYNDDPSVNIKYVTKLTLNQQPDMSYFFPDATFFPLDNLGWVQGGQETASNNHNFGFTSEIRTWFEFNGGESLSFSGDDDVWVFINGRLALDLGGLHPQRAGSFVLDPATAANLLITTGNVYEIALFHAERHTNASNFNLTLNGFTTAKSTCATDCGDGIVAGDELCDDGVNDGGYGECQPGCVPGPFCGDNIVQSSDEACDDGVNLANYSFSGAPGCAPGCVLGAYCGDGNVNSLFGELCDDGVNAGGYDGCNPDCTLGPRCGDGIKQASEGEECDDHNQVSGDGCSSTCQAEVAE